MKKNLTLGHSLSKINYAPIVKTALAATLCGIVFISTSSLAGSQTNTTNTQIEAVASPQILEKAKANTNWKLAFLTGKHAQIVFMNISPQTNPNNEIGMETHKFDQVIFIADGDAKAILNDKSSTVKTGDMIFIPEGTAHNVINLNANKPLKILSIYSDTDIPANSVFSKKSDEPKE